MSLGGLRAGIARPRRDRAGYVLEPMAGEKMALPPQTAVALSSALTSIIFRVVDVLEKVGTKQLALLLISAAIRKFERAIDDQSQRLSLEQALVRSVQLPRQFVMRPLLRDLPVVEH